jgi:hypothetical protein
VNTPVGTRLSVEKEQTFLCEKFKKILLLTNSPFTQDIERRKTKMIPQATNNLYSHNFSRTQPKKRDNEAQWVDINRDRPGII